MIDVVTPPTPLNVQNILKKFAKQNPWSTLVYFLVLIVIPLQDVGLPHVYGKVVQAIQNKAPLVKPFTLLIIMIIIIQCAVLVNEWNETNYVYPSLNDQIRKEIIHVVFDGHETNFDEQHTGALIAKMIRLPNVLYNMVDQYKIVLVPQVIVCIAIITYFAWRDWVLGVGLLISLIIIVTLVNLSPMICITDSCNREQVINIIHEEIDDMLRNMMAIYSADSLKHEEKLLDALQQEYVIKSKATIKCIMGVKGIITPISISVFSFFMYRCYHLIKDKKIDTGTFVSLFFIMLSFMGSIGKYVAQVKELVMRKGIIDVSLKVLDDAIDNIREKQDHYKKEVTSDKPPPADTAIHFDNVTYTYPHGNSPIIEKFTLSIPNRQRVLFVGRIGSGKSTLLRLIMKYKLPQTGQIYFMNKPYNSLSPKMIRSTIGYVPQSPFLFERSIYENITYGLTGISKEQVIELLKSMDLEHIFEGFSEGIDANVGKNGSRLSGGQRQIVWIMRVLLHNPSVLLMDEPTASIDDKTKDTVRNLLTNIMKGRTVIMVTHDKYLERFADRIITLENGKILSDEPREKTHQKFY